MIVDATGGATLRRLGVLQVFAFPMALLTMWFNVGLLVAAVESVFAPPKLPVDLSLLGLVEVMNFGFVLSGILVPVLLLEISFLVWVILDLLKRRAAGAILLKWFSAIGAVPTLVVMMLDGGSHWTHPNPRVRVLGGGLVVLPLIWNLFVLGYLRRYPWRFPTSGIVSAAHRRDIRILGILQILVFPIPFLALWFSVGFAFRAIASDLDPGRAPLEWEPPFDLIDGRVGGFDVSGSFFPILVLVISFVVSTIAGAIQRRTATASVLKWFAAGGAAMALLAMLLGARPFWTYPDPRLGGWGLPLLAAPLLWNPFVLWYLRHHPWHPRNDGGANSSLRA